MDTAGDIYVSDSGAHARVLERATGSNSQIELPFGHVTDPKGVAVDRAGNVYVVDAFIDARVLQLPAGSNTQVELPFTRLSAPGGWRWTPPETFRHQLLSGLIRHGDHRHVPDPNGVSRVIKLPAGSNTQVDLPLTGLRRPIGVAVDAAGSVYVADARTDRVIKLLTQ